MKEQLEWFRIAQTGEPNEKRLYWVWAEGFTNPIIATLTYDKIARKQLFIDDSYNYVIGATHYAHFEYPELPT